jgi:protein-disulfide isomerase
MPDRKTARKMLAAATLIFAATMATLLCRQFSLGPARPSPDFRAFGPKSAKIQIYEYTDFACPACRTAEAYMKNILTVYSEGVRINFKHYPLSSIHPWSFGAAAYADCAGRQGKFLEYSELLFENQEKWGKEKESPKDFSEYAQKLGLNLAAMEQCADDPETLRQIKLDVSEGDMRGVSATPTFFINGERAVGGAQLLEQAKRFDNFLKLN